MVLFLILGDLSGIILKWYLQDKNRKVIIVTSLQFDIKPEAIENYQMKRFLMPSWEFEEYEEAISNEKFFQLIKPILVTKDKGLDKKDLLSVKHYYSGGSVRWMFSVPIKEVIIAIKYYLSRVDDPRKLVGGLSGDRSLISVNHLMMTDKYDNSFLISEYATLLVSEKCELSFVKQARETNLAKKNPTFDGWIFECDFFTQLRLAHKSKRALELTDLDSKMTISLRIRERLYFESVNDINEVWGLLPNTWLLPQLWNNALFDAVQLHSDGEVRIIQVTRAKQHSLKLKYAVKLLRALERSNYKVTRVEFAFIKPLNDENEDFKVNHPVGSWEEFKERTKEDCAVYGIERT